MSRDILAVEDFGAIGDGVADDTEAIPPAIDPAPAGHRVSSTPAVRWPATAEVGALWLASSPVGVQQAPDGTIAIVSGGGGCAGRPSMSA